MRTLPLVLILAFGFIGSVAAAAADTATATGHASDAVDANQAVVWQRRKLWHFTMPLVVNSENGPLQMASCDQLYKTVNVLLLQFGARPGDIHVDERSCYAYTIERSVDVTFSVLAPPGRSRNSVSGPVVEAQWHTVAMKGDCVYLQYVTKKVLPLFTTRNTKLISGADCTRLGVGLYAQVLRAPEERAAAP